MKPRIIRRIAAGICLIVLITGCGGGNTSVVPEEKTVSASSEQEAKVSESSDDSSVAVPKEKADILEKHPNLISYLESEDYQSAETYVHELVLQQKKEAAGDIEDYLVEVNLNSENFEDYFEFATIPRYNAFGEPIEETSIGVRSKKYDEGLIVYSLDDIAVEGTYNSYNIEADLKTLLSFYLSTSYFPDEFSVSYTGRITDGKVTFIKQEFIENYNIPELKKPDDYVSEATVQLKNGEEIVRYVQPDYPF